MKPMEFARDWEAGWNSHDLDRIMAHYHPEITFRSAKAQALVGEGTLKGHATLRAYWGRALEKQLTSLQEKTHNINQFKHPSCGSKSINLHN